MHARTFACLQRVLDAAARHPYLGKAHGVAEMTGSDTHKLYLSFSVASPSNAKTADRIQNRTMTVFSFQPLSSK